VQPGGVIPSLSKADIATYKSPAQTPSQYIQTQAFKNLPVDEQRQYLAANSLVPKSYTLSTTNPRIADGQALTVKIQTNGVTEGTGLFWKISPTSPTGSSSLLPYNGQGVVGKDGSLTFSTPISYKASSPSGDVNLRIQVFTDAQRLVPAGNSIEAVVSYPQPVLPPAKPATVSEITNRTIASSDAITGVGSSITPINSISPASSAVDSLTGLKVIPEIKGVSFTTAPGFVNTVGIYAAESSGSTFDLVGSKGSTSIYTLGGGTDTLKLSKDELAANGGSYFVKNFTPGQDKILLSGSSQLYISSLAFGASIYFGKKVDYPNAYSGSIYFEGLTASDLQRSGLVGASLI
jgi:hypothetical protein